MSKENTAVTKKKMKRCKEDVVFDAACFIILTLVLFVVAYPLYWVIISSISAPSAVYRCTLIKLDILNLLSGVLTNSGLPSSMPVIGSPEK